MTPTDMGAWAIEALEHGRDIALRRQLQTAIRKTCVRVESNDPDGFLGELSGLTTLTATFLNFEARPWFDKAVTSLVTVYEQGFDSHGVAKPSVPSIGGLPPAELWLHVLDRILALGGMAVRLGDWTSTRTLALQRPDGYDFRYYTNWMRHALTEAARANLFRVQTEGGTVVDESVIVRAQRVIGKDPSLHPDVAADSEKALNSLCQFDFLACLAAVSSLGKVDSSAYYPNYARFYSSRTVPIIRRLLTDSVLREAIAPVSDPELMVLLHGLDEAARKEGFRFNGWDGMRDDTIHAWIDTVGV